MRIRIANLIIKDYNRDIIPGKTIKKLQKWLKKQDNDKI